MSTKEVIENKHGLLKSDTKLRLRALVLACSLITAVSLNTGTVFATTIIPWTWEQHVQKSTLLGVVESGRDTTNLLEGKVLESWKGPKTGSKVTVRIPTGWQGEDTFYVTKGQKYLVAAYKTSNTNKKASSASTEHLGQSPTPSALATAGLQGIHALSKDRKGPFREFQSNHADLEEFKNAALSFLALDEETQEFQILKSLSEREMRGLLKNNSNSKVLLDDPKLMRIREGIRSAKSVSQLIKAVIRLKDYNRPAESKEELIRQAIPERLPDGFVPFIRILRLGGGR